MVPTVYRAAVVRRIPGQATGGDDDILIDERGNAWCRLPHSEADSTAPGSTATLTEDGVIVR